MTTGFAIQITGLPRTVKTESNYIQEKSTALLRNLSDSVFVAEKKLFNSFYLRLRIVHSL